MVFSRLVFLPRLQRTAMSKPPYKVGEVVYFVQWKWARAVGEINWGKVKVRSSTNSPDILVAALQFRV